MSKLKKLIFKPHIFFRDALNKRYPEINNEQGIRENDERAIISHQDSLEILESLLLNAKDPIDVVFTWVNNKEQIWKEKKQHYAQLTQDTALYAKDDARFEEHNELFFAVKSVQKFLPWVRYIFIVTDNQTPEWLDEENQQIKIIDHKILIDKQYLPTFNSHVIEAHLHKIPHLSENFIYFNDDVFVAKPLQRSHFFKPNGLASLFLSVKNLDKMYEKGTETPTLLASMNSRKLLRKLYGQELNAQTPLIHSYIPLKKSFFEKVWQTFPNEISGFLSNRFRGKNDLNLATFFIPYAMYFEGESVITPEVCYYFNIRSVNAASQYKKLLRKKNTVNQPHSFCANDFHSNVNIPNYKELLITTLEKYYNGDKQ
ncbi:capsule biosynthesis protein CapC [Rodentibacter genomosp. 1]|uniref:Capsule biosynthesis protein CapC n=1 Tax=Rodentibacter genomosp. 1 TaxID=1908264 RepID=A0A1V3J9F0_9PAST|nr:stealth conserved region 3 domain-containing protein [Rodentibacter genomosp. 1]OOF52088.1 capsule biosynthesis protein CapC [Rodentibacter genomosp. 1]